jgi:hypothetical protein
MKVKEDICCMIVTIFHYRWIFVVSVTIRLYFALGLMKSLIEDLCPIEANVLSFSQLSRKFVMY